MPATQVPGFKVQVQGTNLVIQVPINTALPLSKKSEQLVAAGKKPKARICASTGGFAETGQTFSGRKITMSIVAIVPA